MTALKYILVPLVLLLLFFLRRYFPNRRVFYLFCLTIIAAGAFTGIAIDAQKPETQVMSDTEKYALLQQQQIFTSWYTDYKKDIEQLDHNWQQYHRILADFKADNISIQTPWVRLQQLDAEAAQLDAVITKMAPPPTLEGDNYDLVIEIIKKTQTYSAAQHQAILRTRAAADPSRQISELQEEQSRRLEEIMILESPAGLFTASEISALRENLTIPEEQ